MITANMEDYPEHRIHFYLLLTAIITHTFQAFFQIPPASQVCIFLLHSSFLCVTLVILTLPPFPPVHLFSTRCTETCH